MAAFRPLLAVVLLALAACACDAQYLGRRVGKVTSAMRAPQVTGSRGDYNSTGTVALALFKYGETYNIRYSVHVWRLDRPEIPKKATVHYGTRFTTGPVQIEFSDNKWVNMTSNYQRPNRPKLYTYVIAGVWHDVAKIKAANGKSLEVTMKAIIAAPRQYYALVTAPSHPDGAIRGQFHRSR
ncbi:unnamed protein product [Closterium sp. NIES-64]|nr:unnamed protein product [Closterium sp. NIES-64]